MLGAVVYGNGVAGADTAPRIAQKESLEAESRVPCGSIAWERLEMHVPGPRYSTQRTVLAQALGAPGSVCPMRFQACSVVPRVASCHGVGR